MKLFTVLLNLFVAIAHISIVTVVATVAVRRWYKRWSYERTARRVLPKEQIVIATVTARLRGYSFGIERKYHIPVTCNTFRPRIARLPFFVTCEHGCVTGVREIDWSVYSKEAQIFLVVDDFAVYGNTYTCRLPLMPNVRQTPKVSHASRRKRKKRGNAKRS